jgi:sugar phosphate isomerase/epimerase
MLRGLTRAGIGNVGDLETFVEKAAEYGFQTVDAGGKELQGLIDARGLDGAQAFLKEHRVSIGSIGLPVQWRADEEQFREGLVQLSLDAKAAAALNCRTCCTYIVPSTDYNAAHFMAIAIRRLRLCAQILGAYGLRLGLEFVGPHHQRTLWKNPFIWTARETLEMADAMGEPNVGLLFDAYHWYTAEMDVEDIYSLSPEQIVHVHINDAPDVPLPEALDNGRLYPGEGIINLKGFLEGLQRIGYNGVVSQEILMQQKLPDSSDALLMRSKAGFDKVWQAAGL